LCGGQEAVPVGLSDHLVAEDLVFSGHRSHGHFLAKGGSLRDMVAELYGRVTGCAAGRGGSQHLIDLAAGFIASAPILAATIPIATGAAWAIKNRGLPNVAVVYFGDGATEEGAFYEAVNYAAIHKLPVLFVCENNLYSVHSALDVRRPQGRNIVDIAAGFGVFAERLDGNDIGTVWKAGRLALERARRGEGPTFLEFTTYRWMEHCGPLDDSGLGYRSKAELDAWKQADPLVGSARRLNDLLPNGLAAVAEAEAAIRNEISDAIGFAQSSLFPRADTLLEFTLPTSRVAAES
jgi:TPP-dependent pyruvate/acetoin dehydrogenase alpha subunit